MTKNYKKLFTLSKDVTLITSNLDLAIKLLFVNDMSWTQDRFQEGPSTA